MYNTKKWFGLLLALILLAGIASATTQYFYAPSTAADARIQRDGVNENFSTIRVGAGTAITNASSTITVTYLYSDFTGYYEGLGRYGWVGDTSSIPNDATITSATFSLYGAGTKTNSVGDINASLVGFIPATPTNLVKADFNTRQTTKYATDIPYATWSNTSWNNFTLNAAGLAAINKTGYTQLMITNTWDADNSTVGLTGAGYTYSRLQANDTTAGVNIPVLTVEYTEAAPTIYNITFYAVYDGSPYRYVASRWGSLRNGAGTGVLVGNNILPDIESYTTTDNFLWDSRGAVTFNTSTIGTSSTIINATLTGIGASYTNNLGSPEYAWIDFTPVNKSSYVAADYQATTYTRMTDNKSITDFGGDQPVNWSMNSLGISNISKTGLTSFMLAPNWTIDNQSPTWPATFQLSQISVRGYRYLNGTYSPRLTIYYNTSSPGSPAADFTANVTSGTAPLSVQFTDLSSNTPDRWDWEWRNSSPVGTWNLFSHDKNPIETFSLNGSYDIKLWSANGLESGNYETKYGYIYVGSPYSAFTANTTVGKPPLTVQFTDLSENGVITDWDWYFGNGTKFSDSQNPIVSFTSVGLYGINLRTVGQTTDWENRTEYIACGYAPTAHFDMVVI